MAERGLADTWSRDFISSVLTKALSKGGEYADVFFENTADTRINLDAGKIKTLTSGIVSGAGVRVISGRSSVYLFASNVTEAKLVEMASGIADTVASGKAGSLEIPSSSVKGSQSIAVWPGSVDTGRKVDMLKAADAAAREYSAKVCEAMVMYWDNDQEILVASSDGVYVSDRRTRTRLAVTAIAEENGRKERGFFGPGKSMGFELFDRYPPETIGKEAARIACLLLTAEFAPQGTMPVVIENAFGGVIFHEACGHALEATSVADDASVFTGKMGQKIASEVVTAVDDGTIPNEWGSSAFDDEGHRTRRNVLIRGGVLTSYMVDKFGSVKMGVPMTGNSRRESYRFAPTSRMTNTYIANGPHGVKSMIGSIDSGLYCTKMSGGSVNPATTEFNFSVMEAYLIKNGRIDKPVKGAALIGKGCDIIRNIEMVSDNLDFGTGMCGSNSGSVPANVGQPAIKVGGLVVGGRS